MTLTERVRTCSVEGCRRAPIKDGRDCPDHLPRWRPTWLRLAMERPEGLRRDLTGLG